MYSFYRSHPRLMAVLILAVSMLMAFMNCPPRLHNDDMQQMFQILNGGVGEPNPFGLHNNVFFGWFVGGMTRICPHVNWYLLGMLVVIAVALLVINEFVLCRRSRVPQSGFNVVADAGCLLFLIFINQWCFADLQVQYTHTGILAGVGVAFVLFSALMGEAGWKRIAVGLFLFFGMFILRPESIMSFVFLAGGVVMAWWAIRGFCKPTRPAVVLLLGMGGILLTCVVAAQLAYAASPEWDDALTYRKLRVHIQDYPDNSGVDKTGALRAAGIDPVQFAIYKKFVYVPTLDDVKLIDEAREIHVKDNKGVFGSELAARHGLLAPEKAKMIAPFTDLVQATPWFPLVAVVGLFVLTVRKESARAILPVLLATGAYVLILMLAGRCTGRVLYPALFYATAWALAFLPSDSVWGRYRLLRWGCVGAILLFFAVSMRHYRVHWNKPVAMSAEEICRSHPENIYLATTIQASSLFNSGLFGYTQEYLRETNVVPISDGWIFYTPAYREFLKARHIENPYLLAANENVFFVVKDAAGECPRVLQHVDTLYNLYNGGGHLAFRKVAEDRSISFWKAEKVDSSEFPQP